MGKDRGNEQWQSSIEKLHLSLNIMHKKGLLFLLFCLLFCILHAQQKQYQLNQFSFEDTRGIKYNLGKLSGKIVFVDCWFPACPPCRTEMPYSALLQKRLKALGIDTSIVFVTICFKQSTAEWKTALQQLHMPEALHLYSPASTYEMVLAGGNYPTYRIFNQSGILDIEPTAAPSQIGKIDFLLFAAVHQINITEAKQMFDEQGNKLLIGTIKKSKYAILNQFYEKFKPMEAVFKKDWLQLSN